MISSIILVILFISVLITIHEFGHLIVAKLAKIPVEAFWVGFGPVILKKKLGETEYRLSIVPLGGYIKMVGEEEKAAAGSGQPAVVPPGFQSYSDKPLWVKVAVIIAGPVSNLILGFLMLVAMYLAFGMKHLAPTIEPVPGSAAAGLVRQGDLLLRAGDDTIPDFERFESVLKEKAGTTIELALLRDGQRMLVQYQVPSDGEDLEPLVLPVVDRVRRGGPADKLGLKPGDLITSAAGRPIVRWEDFADMISARGGQPTEITWRRGDRLFSDTIVPSVERDQMSEQRIGQVGVWVKLPKKVLPLGTVVWEALKRTGFVVEQTFVVLYKVVTRQISTKAIGGPIMVAKVAYEGVSWGAEYFIALWALLSINLFVVNMLPVPVLDGGRILLDVIAGARRRKLSEKEMNWAANIGWVLIGLLVLFTIFNDLMRIIRR